MEHIWPELILFVFAVIVLLGHIGLKDMRPQLMTMIALFGFFLALAAVLVSLNYDTHEMFSKSFLIDPVSQFFKVLLISGGAICVLLTFMSTEVKRTEKAEMHALILLGTLAMCILSSAVHFLILYLAYEMIGVTCLVLAAFKRKSALSSEAGMKLYVHSALTSILFAFGIVLLYGVAKSFNILEIRAQLLVGATVLSPAYIWIAYALIFLAVAARIAAFPLHSLSPDIIEGSPTPTAAFLAVSANVAAMAFAIRLFVHLFSSKIDGGWESLPGFAWPHLLAGIAAATITLGNLTAISQTNLKRLFGYSCIAQIGYVLLGLVVLNHNGLAATLFSLAAYSIMTLGAFFAIQIVTDESGSERIETLKGLIWRRPFEGAALCIFLLGLAGMPPIVGFVGKFYLLGVIVREKIYWLAVVVVANWVVALTYYLTMIRQIFSQNGQKRFEETYSDSNLISRVTLTVLLIPTIYLGLYWDPMMLYISRSLASVVW